MEKNDHLCFSFINKAVTGMTNETIDRILLKHLLPQNLNVSTEIGLYGVFYKLSILIVLFIQTFRFGRTIFLAQEKEKNSRKVYAEVMKYFVIITSFIFLVVTMLYDFIILFLGKDIMMKGVLLPYLFC